MLVANGGLVMVNFYSYFVTCSADATLSQVRLSQLLLLLLLLRCCLLLLLKLLLFLLAVDRWF